MLESQSTNPSYRHPILEIVSGGSWCGRNRPAYHRGARTRSATLGTAVQEAATEAADWYIPRADWGLLIASVIRGWQCLSRSNGRWQDPAWSPHLKRLKRYDCAFSRQAGDGSFGGGFGTSGLLNRAFLRRGLSLTLVFRNGGSSPGTALAASGRRPTPIRSLQKQIGQAFRRVKHCHVPGFG